MASKKIQMFHGDCLEIMKNLPTASVDAVVTDPPAGIGFMGKSWDKAGVLGVSGGNAMPAVAHASRNPTCQSCGGRQRAGEKTKGCSCEFPQWNGTEIKQKDRENFVIFLRDRMVEARRIAKPGAYALVWALPRTSHWTATAIEDAGWVIRDRVSHLFGTGFPKAKSCLKPACEDWWLAWNPAKKVTPLNIDECRISVDSSDDIHTKNPHTVNLGSNQIYGEFRKDGSCPKYDPSQGRWPANVTHDGSPEVLEAFAAFGERGGGDNRRTCSGRRNGGFLNVGSENGDGEPNAAVYSDTGSAARFFYCAKASRSDRGPDNSHPTVKNTELMRWLCRLITPPGGTVLDPFAGSGSTGKACIFEGFKFIGIEKEKEYFDTSKLRLRAASEEFARGIAS